MDVPVKEGFAAVGEVALSGAIRPVSGLSQRVAEAARLGFTDVVVPSAGKAPDADGIRVHAVSTLAEAVALALPQK
jgi:DNA repair protein RadA/Sms